MNFNTILGKIYDMNLDEVLSDCRGDSYLSIKKRVKKQSGTSLYPDILSLIVPFPLVEISYYCRKHIGGDSFHRLTFCIEILYDSFESYIWILCTYYRNLGTSQIDSPRNSEHYSFFKRHKRPYITILGSKKY